MIRREPLLSLSPASFWSLKAEQGLNFKAPFELPEFERSIESIGNHAKILDIGCGYGRILDLLHRKGYEDIEGVDFAPGMIARGQREFPHLIDRLQCNTEKTLPFENQTFDVVILFSVLTCNIHNEDQQNLVNEIKRVLKPGGCIYINDFLISDHEERRGHYNQAHAIAPDTAYGVFEMRRGSGACRHHSRDWMNHLLSEFQSEWYNDKDIPTIGGVLDKPFQLIARFFPGQTFEPIPPIERAARFKK